ncbi:MAG: cation diffusion facilitator family transporter [Spirochaetaceae bacterium]|jgi:cation diffusion facilitator family transporter|nr:cation diffusion facilitator family transporter [Spirochaetaceae bacterium]
MRYAAPGAEQRTGAGPDAPDGGYSADKTKTLYCAGVVSVTVNSVLFAAKLAAGIMADSIALTADAWHTLSDSISSLIVVAAVKLASRKADKEHPFGHGRWEHIASLFIAFILGIIGFDFLKNAFSRFQARDSAEFGAAALAVTALSVLIKEALAQYAFYAGRKTGSPAVSADGWHHRSDALSSAAVLGGIFLSPRFWWIDSALGAVIGVMLGFAAYTIVKNSVTKLLGEEPERELIDRISAAARGVYPYELYLHHFHIHNYVSRKELTVHIRLNKDMTIEQGHRIAKKIERAVREQCGIIATVRLEPLRKPREAAQEPCALDASCYEDS